MMTYREALEYIHSVNWTFCKPGLERIAVLCEKLGNPQNELKFIHVAGTNGKGSFCAMLDSVLRAASYKTGLFTSPYIKEFNERIQYNGENISDDELAEVTEFVKPIADAMEDKPTEFELITAIGFEYFRRKGCDVVILEAGLGGRLDSTNIVNTSVLSVITGIALEHTEILGDTVEKIAYEKAGIIKPSVPVLFGGDSDEANAVICKRALELGCEYRRVDRSSLAIDNADLGGTTFSFDGSKDLFISLLGLYQTQNAANVLTAINMLQSVGFEIGESAVREGLKKAAWHARFEVISTDPLIIFDGAHNPQGIDTAVMSIKQYFGDDKVCVLSGVMKDKDYDYMVSRLSEISDVAFTVTPSNPRALDAVEYAKVFERYGVKAKGYDELSEAVVAAKRYARDNSKPLVCLGSLYMYGDIVDKI